MSNIRVNPVTGLYSWLSGDAQRGDSCLEISRQTRDEISIRINGRNSYTPVDLTLTQAEELMEALITGTDAAFQTMSPYGTTTITLTVTHEQDDIIFLARFKKSLDGYAVGYGEVPAMIKILNIAIEITAKDLQATV